MLPDQLLMPAIVGMDSDAGISENRLRARRGYLDGCRATRLDDTVLDVMQHTEFDFLFVAGHIEERASPNLHVNNFEVGDGRVELRAPVDQPIGSVDETLLMESNKSLLDGSGEIVIHGKGLAIPVHRRAHALECIVDAYMVLFFPLVSQFDELLPAYVMPRSSLTSQ